jgi:hypothetical protein
MIEDPEQTSQPADDGAPSEPEPSQPPHETSPFEKPALDRLIESDEPRPLRRSLDLSDDA